MIFYKTETSSQLGNRNALLPPQHSSAVARFVAWGVFIDSRLERVRNLHFDNAESFQGNHATSRNYIMVGS